MPTNHDSVPGSKEPIFYTIILWAVTMERPDDVKRGSEHLCFPDILPTPQTIYPLTESQPRAQLPFYAVLSRCLSQDDTLSCLSSKWETGNHGRGGEKSRSVYMMLLLRTN